MTFINWHHSSLDNLGIFFWHGNGPGSLLRPFSLTWSICNAELSQCLMSQFPFTNRAVFGKRVLHRSQKRQWNSYFTVGHRKYFTIFFRTLRLSHIIIPCNKIIYALDIVEDIVKCQRDWVSIKPPVPLSRNETRSANPLVHKQVDYTVESRLLS